MRLTVADLERAQAFYIDALGFAIMLPSRADLGRVILLTCPRIP